MVTAESNTTIVLTDDDWQLAVQMGTRRHEMAEARGYLQTDGTRSRNGLANHIRGAGGEIATAKFYELKWDATINGFRKIPDLLVCEIRSTAEDTPYLRIKVTDREKGIWPFILVTRLGDRRYRIEGWFYGYEGMKQQYYVGCDRHSKRPEWHVPIRDLHWAFTLQSTLWKLRGLKESVTDEARHGAAAAGQARFGLVGHGRLGEGR